MRDEFSQGQRALDSALDRPSDNKSIAVELNQKKAEEIRRKTTKIHTGGRGDLWAVQRRHSANRAGRYGSEWWAWAILGPFMHRSTTVCRAVNRSPWWIAISKGPRSVRWNMGRRSIPITGT